MVMFSLVTLGTALQLDVQSISYIDNRKFPGVEGVFPPGPIGYQELINPNAVQVIQNVVLTSSNWLADGFLVSSLLVLRPLVQTPNAGSSGSIVAMLSTL